MKNNKFFEKQTPSSKIKANIVSAYFPNYCNIITRNYKPEAIRYIDLFSGPGMYNDGNYSTPLLVAKTCQVSAFLKQKVKMIFNDNQYSESLKENFYNIFGADVFEKKPHFGKSTVGESQKITDFLIENTHDGVNNKYPSLLFIDPFGYKGIETRVLAEFLKNWGNEIFIFVNTKRIHPALENDKFSELMNDLFPTTLERIKKDRKFKSTVSERLSLIINSLGGEYSSIIGKRIYYTAFKFQEEDSDATSHYILHLTKGERGYDLIKTIYTDFANVGTIFDGVNTYTFDAKQIDNSTNQLFDLKSMNIDFLKEDIFKNYAGKSLCAFDLFDNHQKNSLYSRSHYTEALRRLVNEGKLESTFTDTTKHKVSVLLSKNCNLKFK